MNAYLIDQIINGLKGQLRNKDKARDQLCAALQNIDAISWSMEDVMVTARMLRTAPFGKH